ncbi:putative fluoride ion transporter CrcB [Caprobacter fermentans]|uniref:Fluoride-specific ion channel FluC n=1 Tax=Caproicibacter fermentans TaxID=2576756 RepID=A0A6N8I2M4_9FIRM|nr:fluoride efflux transporter CrcB [Caproicibacter fermentans]MVB11793.1 putative fluoride ion transporter CrcB [Caproicibacter fermentans]OCN00785.1 camphor resistance protein CrcB [Clostridium sp. W14A]QNK41726.1 fluoride efflux transporter CrcB [Caproicibacter fermentans]
MKASRFLIVGMGGFFGAALRYLISCMAVKLWGEFPLGTLIVNLAGGFLMGFIMEAAAGSWSLPDEMKIFLTTGMMGGLTTFSTFSYETVSLFSNDSYWLGGLNVGLNLSLALLACWAGKSVAQMI